MESLWSDSLVVLLARVLDSGHVAGILPECLCSSCLGSLLWVQRGASAFDVSLLLVLALCVRSGREEFHTRQALRGVVTLLAIVLLLSGCRSKAAVSKQPSACQSECVTPFGTELGAHHGIVARSNCRPACIDPTPHEVAPAKTGLQNKTYTGIRWQCVEYARRWWLIERGVVFPGVDTADDMWTEVTSAKHLASSAAHPVHKYENGGSEIPRLGDLVIYKARPQSVGLKYGHVAVVVEVNVAEGFVSLAEQNFLNQAWKEPKVYARRLSLESSAAGASLLDEDPDAQIYGWLRVTDAAAP